MNNKEMTTAITEYLSDGQGYYAIMIDGAWGSGKTHYVEQDESLGEVFAKEDKSPLRISLFGLASAGELNSKILEKAINGDRSGIAATIKKISKELGVRFLSKKIGFDVLVKPEVLLPIFLKDKVLILDDFERCLIDYGSMLGIINDFVENQKLKVVILCDESKVITSPETETGDDNSDEGNAKEKYAQARTSEQLSYIDLKEKVIWRTYSYTPDFYGVAELLLAEAFDAYEELDWKRCLKKGIEQSECFNLRSVLKIRLLLLFLAKTEFFSTVTRDACQREDVLSDIINVTLRYVSGYRFEASISAENATKRPYTGLELALFAHDSKSSVFDYHACDLYQKLGFLKDYFNGRQDVGSTNDSLVQYCEISYPLGQRSREIVTLLEKASYFEMENDEAIEFVNEVVNAAKSDEIPFSQMEKTIYLIDRVQQTGIFKSADLAQRVTNYFTDWVSINAESFGDNAEYYFHPSFGYADSKYVVAFREKVEEVCNTNKVSDPTKLLLDDSLDKVIERQGIVPMNSVLSINIREVVSAIENSSIRELGRLQTNLQQLFRNTFKDTQVDVDAYLTWLMELKSEVEKAKVTEGMRSFRRDCIVEYAIVPEIDKYRPVEQGLSGGKES